MEQLLKIVTGLTLSLAILATGCTYRPTFAFPIEQGSIEAGRQAQVSCQNWMVS